MGFLSLLFGLGKSESDNDDPKGRYENPKDRWGLGRDAAEDHRRWEAERSKDP